MARNNDNRTVVPFDSHAGITKPTELFAEVYEHGWLEVDHDPDAPDGLYIQAAAHAAQGFAYLDRDAVERLHDTLRAFLWPKNGETE